MSPSSRMSPAAEMGWETSMLPPRSVTGPCTVKAEFARTA